MTVGVERSHPYPTTVLEGRETCLLVFAAAFGGVNDAVWIQNAGLKATCVDNDPEKLEQMQPGYPDSWEFVLADAYEYAAAAALGPYAWDVVSLDPFTNHMDRCSANLPSWSLLARHAIILGTGVDTVVEAPDGWYVTDVVQRTDYQGGVFWTVLERP